MKAKESLNEFLNEDNMLPSSSTFKSDINGTRDVSIWNHEWDDISSAVMHVEWEFQIEAREWGIKGLGIKVNKVYGEFEVEVYPNKEAEYPDEETIEFSYNDEEWDIKTDIQVENPFVSDLYPNEIEIDYKKKEITVIF